MPVNTALATEQFERFQYCRDRSHLAFLEKAEKCDNFFAGDQWSKADLARLNLQRRPALTINKIISTISTILGEQIFNRAEVDYRPKTGAKSETADALNKVWRHIAQNNQLQWTRSDVFCDGIIRSRGFYDLRLDFTDSMRGEAAVTLLNSKNVVIDPDAEEYDPDKWNDVFTTKWMTPQDIAILYSKADAEILQHAESSAFPFGFDSIERARNSFSDESRNVWDGGLRDPDKVRRNIRVLDRQFHRLDSRKHFVDRNTGDMRPVPDTWERERIAYVIDKYRLDIVKKLVKRIRWTVTADNVILHDEWSPYKHFTVIPYFPFFRYGRTIGIVENLLGPQELLNKTTSQELHVVNTTANSGWKMKAGSLRNMSVEELEQNGSRTGLVLELDDIANAEKIQPNQIPTGLERLSYKAEESIKTISNVTDSMQGNDREDVAAKAIAYKQQRGSINFSKVMDNLERTDYLLARNTLDLVKSFYTEPRILTITHDITGEEPEELRVKEVDSETGEIVNDLTLGEYDIVISSAPFRATLEDSQFEQGKGMRELGIPIPDDILIENSRLARKNELIKRLQGDKESPEAQARAALEQRAAEAEVSKVEGEAEDRKADALLKTTRAQKEAAEAEGGNAAELEKVRLEAELKRELQAEELSMKREAHEEELRMKRETHAQELELAREKADAERRAAEEAAREQRITDAMTAGTPTEQ